MAMGTSLGQGSPSEVARPERPPRTYEPSGHEEGVYNVHAAVVGRPSSVGFQSDSSSMSSHRRRFRVREHEAAEDNLTPMSVRPGKKDKSLQRKSALNLPGPDGQGKCCDGRLKGIFSERTKQQIHFLEMSMNFTKSNNAPEKYCL